MRRSAFFVFVASLPIISACSASDQRLSIQLFMHSKTECELIFKSPKTLVVENFCDTEKKPILIKMADREIRSDWIDEKTFPKKWLPERLPTLASLLHDGGYRTGFVGKWHCGQSWVHQPGFDFYVGENKDQYPHRGQCKFNDNGRDVTYVGQRSDFLTSRAIDFLSDTSDKRPVFLFVGLTDTHSPFTDHPQHLVDYYAANPLKSVKVEKYTGKATRVPGKMPLPTEHQRRMAQYAASVEMIDQCVGRVLDHLTALGTANNTAVLYTGDHGHMNGHHGLYYKGNATIPQNFYDESIRVPCVWRMPGKSAAGQVTVCETNGVAISAAYKLLSNTFTVGSSGMYYFGVSAT